MIHTDHLLSVYVRRNADGELRLFEQAYPSVEMAGVAAEIWRDGNNSCDCNRAALCFDEEAPCGDTAYTLVQLVVDGENWGIE